MKKHVDITIYGNLQKSGFRFSAVDKALELELTGFVKDYEADKLEIAIEGDMESLQKFLKWCHVGPEKAEIEKVDFDSTENLENYESFTAEWYK